jgi:hypothetical protein
LYKDARPWARALDQLRCPTGKSLVIANSCPALAAKINLFCFSESFILALPPAEPEREHWQIAMEFLIFAAEKGGIVMTAQLFQSWQKGE